MDPDHPFDTRKLSKFSLLPTELRLMVWTETFQPRILHITSEKATIELRSYTTTTRFRAREPPPVALHVCRESRALALKHYTLSFYSSISPAWAQERSAIYFNPELDTALLVDLSERGVEYFYNLFRGVNEPTFRRARVLAFGARLPLTEMTYLPAMELFWFKGLETLVLVVETGAESDEGGRIRGREYMEDRLIRASDLLRLRWTQDGKDSEFEWKLPGVKVMNPEAFESHYM